MNKSPKHSIALISQEILETENYFNRVLKKGRSRNSSNHIIFSIKKVINKIFLNPKISIHQKKHIITFLKNYSESAIKKREKFYRVYKVAPESYVLGITDECNLNCRYCYSRSGQKMSHNMDIDVALTIISEMEKTFGIRYVTISGGETFPKVLQLAEKCKSILFYVYSNGTRIDKATAKFIRKLGNIIPSLSLIGPKSIHDKIRGNGSFDQMMEGVQNLKNESVVWGFSITESKINFDEIVGGNIFDFCDSYSPYFLRLIPYVPVGRDDHNLPLSVEERKKIAKSIQLTQKKYDFIIYDYVNDKSLGINCMAGGGRYFYINPSLKMTPCVFMDEGKKILYNQKTHTTNVVDILLNDPIMQRARDLSKLSCIVLDNPNWKTLLLGNECVR